MKKKILYYALQPNDSTSFWRIKGIFPFIESSDFELIDSSYTVNFNWSVLINCSVLIMQRPFAPDHVRLMTLAKDMGIKIILDYDDSLNCIDEYNPTFANYALNQKSLQECLRLADELWVSTVAIAKEYRHPKTFIIPNAHNDYLFPVKGKKPFKANQKVMYRGGSSHQADVNEIADDLVKVMNDNTDWTFIFMGDMYTYLSQRTGDNHHLVGAMSIIQYFNYLHEENPSIMIFPLRNTRFNHCKSNISWIEGTYAGAAFFGNKELPEFNLSCISPLSDLMKIDTDVLKDCNEKSWEYIQDNLLLSKVNEIRTERILANL